MSRWYQLVVVTNFVLTMLIVLPAHGESITFSGKIFYDGSSVGDTLYVAVLDTAVGEDGMLLDLVAIEATDPPFGIDYSLEFDNTSVSPQLLIASFLDVNGGGVSEIDGVDVFGWYGSSPIPASVSSASSQSGLDFSLPTGEIHGTLTLANNQVETRINPTPDITCMIGGFRPGTYFFASGEYSIIGVYPGSYCISARGNFTWGNRTICHGDPDCATPTSVVIGEGEAVSGIDFDFSAVATQESSWGQIKARFR